MVVSQLQDLPIGEEHCVVEEQYFGEHQEVYEVSGQKLLLDMGFKALSPRTHPLEVKIAQHESVQLGHHAIEYEGFINVFGDNDALVAGLILHRRWNGVSIYSFFVEPALRGKGLGKRLLQLAEEMAIQMGGTALILETSTLHTWQFYVCNGFKILSETTGYIDGQTYFYMLKNLNCKAASERSTNQSGREACSDNEAVDNG